MVVRDSRLNLLFLTQPNSKCSSAVIYFCLSSLGLCFRMFYYKYNTDVSYVNMFRKKAPAKPEPVITICAALSSSVQPPPAACLSHPDGRDQLIDAEES